ncbi:methyltransferase [Actinomycetospora atypica]|uniref:Methyltransferase n=1 Tax=Actinomycetospora atypica TaxID=1290095 RepID=A0ABV9YUF2_9PSEU
MAAAFTVELDPTPGRRQGEEQFLLHRDGATERLVLHDYAAVYSVPGLYEEVVQNQLQCASPATVAEAAVEAATSLGLGPAQLRVFDLGAGNGVVGEELRARGATVVVGADGIPEARDAAHRDRPGLYDHYLVGERLDGAEVTRLVTEERLNALVAAGAVGEGHVPVDALDELWSTFPSGSVLALTLKDGNLDDHDVSDVEAMVAARSDTTTVVHRRFRHRLSMAGDELHYVVLAATKA